MQIHLVVSNYLPLLEEVRIGLSGAVFVGVQTCMYCCQLILDSRKKYLRESFRSPCRGLGTLTNAD